VSDTLTIYIRLLDEGTDVWRPTQGRPVDRDRYEVLPTADYDPEEEVWEFPPGSLVICHEHDRSGHWMLVAEALAESPGG